MPPEPIRIEARGAGAVLHLAGVVGVAQAKRLQQSRCWYRRLGSPCGSSRRPRTYSRVSEAGVRWTGLVPGRAQDALGVGWVDAIVSPALRRQVRGANAADGGTRPVPDHEAAFEAAYQMKFGTTGS